MIYPWRKVGEIVGAHRIGMFTVVKLGVTRQNKVDFFFAIVRNAPTTSVSIDRDYAETSDALEPAILRIALPKNGLVVARLRGPGYCRTTEAWHVAMQPCRIDLSFLRRQVRQKE